MDIPLASAFSGCRISSELNERAVQSDTTHRGQDILFHQLTSNLNATTDMSCTASRKISP